MDNNEEQERVLNTTILNTGIATPISVSKEDAIKLAQEQQQNSVVQEQQVVAPQQQIQSDNIAVATQISKEELNEQMVNEVNDLMKNDYVKYVEIKHSKKTYIILILVLAAILGIVIFEIIYYGGQM